MRAPADPTRTRAWDSFTSWSRPMSRPARPGGRRGRRRGAPMRIVWVSADQVAVGELGVTDRIEGPRYFLRRGDDVLLVTGGPPGARPIEDIPTRFLRARYLPFVAWIAL